MAGINPDNPNDMNTEARSGLKLGYENFSESEMKVVKTPKTETKMR